MPDEPEEGFTVRDRRRFSVENADTSVSDSAPDRPGTAAAAAPAAPASVAENPAEPISALPYPGEEDPLSEGGDPYGAGQIPDVYSVLALFLGELRNLAWLRMGLVANPGTGEIERDLPQAKIAIDTVTFLAMQLEPVVSPEERLPLKALVSDLQVNFVEQSKRA
ncbi:MAG: DUF1844 domain-containing protein [Cytophagales bacterium]|nr:DUF1844 domain-containing protein [Armatimonadota bacterium]